MKRERRRVRVAKRQKLLAEVSQRAAMRGLADALAEEYRSAALAERSRALVKSYSDRSHAVDGASVQHTVAFSGALASLASDAEAARADASQQREWQAQALGHAQARARRLSERFDEALSAYDTALAKRENDPATLGSAGSQKNLARPVQSDEQDRPAG